MNKNMENKVNPYALISTVNAIKQGNSSSYAILSDKEVLIVINSLSHIINSMLTKLNEIKDKDVHEAFNLQLKEILAVNAELQQQLIINNKPKVTA